MHLLKWIYHLNCAMFDLKSQEYHIKHKVRKILCFQVLTSIICRKPFLKFIKREKNTEGASHLAGLTEQLQKTPTQGHTESATD